MKARNILSEIPNINLFISNCVESRTDLLYDTLSLNEFVNL